MVGDFDRDVGNKPTPTRKPKKRSFSSPTATWDKDEVKLSVSIREYLEVFDPGLELHDIPGGFRCRVPYDDNSDNPQSFSVHEEIADGRPDWWYNFAHNEGGDIIALCRNCEEIDDFATAVNTLGERFGVEPRKPGEHYIRKPKPKPAPQWPVVYLAICDNEPEHASATDEEKQLIKKGLKLYEQAKQANKELKAFPEELFERLIAEWKQSTQPRTLPADAGEAEAQGEGRQPFTNVVMVPKINENGKLVQQPRPKKLNVLSREIFDDYGGWPCNIGGVLFDFHAEEKPERRIEKLLTSADLFAWIARKGDRNIDWLKSRGCHTKEELFAQLKSAARRYEMISFAPHFPKREDVFYSVPKLPPPDPSHAAFEKFVDFFNPCDAAHRTIMKSFFLTPLWFNPGRDKEFVNPKPKPGFVIDTVDAQASGKSTVVNKCAQLYGTSCIRKSKTTLTDETAVKKSILSEEGRRKRIFLLDNVTGTLKSDFLADLMTTPEITGLAPYGHGDESRPNDLTFAVTVNGAELDTDLATRFYIIKIHAPDPALLAQSMTSEKTIWESKIDQFIADYRLQIFADMIDALDNAPFRSRAARFPAYDAKVLSAASNSDAEFDAAVQAIVEEASNANVDKANAETFEALVANLLAGMDAAVRPTMITNAAVAALMEREPTFKNWSVNTLRSRLLKTNLLPHFSKTFERFPPNNPDGRERGFFYGLHLQGDGATTQYQVLDWSVGTFKITRSGFCERKQK